MDTPKGLLVPVIKDASDQSIEQISAEVKTAGACREGTISPDNLSGGSFTLTNLGMLGVETFTPVLNAPEVAILEWEELYSSLSVLRMGRSNMLILCPSV